jgi:hypothetical protein
MGEVFLNCWEVKNCGREPEGVNVPLYGICPISTDSLLDGIHKGKNGGRCCWVLIPTISKNFDKAAACSGGFHECNKCEFYKSVRATTMVLVKI